ncbi:hypothetical protein LPTSP3_g09500 [Leptospira kobayashii]|uniref:PPM-type phosphatase domain-containing protein n=1 Tax=Leptospira kobayashii TaxID=1917830 RepID=A0ABN6KAP5_9LEPT|nr:SpoIIE family protein phosphatase [Leptospira kobayashii]BDA78020.1 hypothetical protein LPTSP3_g09500 [Leptospira kobayashii]
MLRFLSICFFLLAYSDIAAQTQEEVRRLETGWTFTDFGTNETKPVQVGQGLVDQGYSVPIRGVYRLEVDIAKPAVYTQGIFLDRLHSVDSTFWNGKSIGSTGKFSPDYYPYWISSRFYSIPTDSILLGKNVLEVQIECREVEFMCGIFRNIPRMGSYESLKDELIYEDLRQLVFVSLFFGIFIQQAISYILNRSSHAGLYLAATAILFVTWRLPILHKIHFLDWNPELLVRTLFFSQCMFPCAIILFVYSLFEEKPSRIVLGLLSLDVVIGFIQFFPLNPDYRFQFVYLWYVLLAFKVPLLITLLARFYNKKSEAIVVSIGALVATCFGIADIVSDLAIGKNQYLSQYGIFAFMFSGILAIGIQNARTRNALKNLNESLEMIVGQRTQELEKQYRILSDEMHMAGSLQSKLIPSMQGDVCGLKVNSVYIPMEKIGGDYYDFYIHDKDTVMFLLCDVLGHGIPAALIASMLKISFLELGPKHKEPDRLLEELNLKMIPVVDKNYITALACSFDLKSMEVRYSVMGHPNPIFVSGTGHAPVILDGKGPILGWRKEAKIQSWKMNLYQGDRYFFYTDGITEAQNSYKELFGESRLLELLSDGRGLEPKQLNKKILDSVRTYSPKLSDDLTFFTVEMP